MLVNMTTPGSYEPRPQMSISTHPVRYTWGGALTNYATRELLAFRNTPGSSESRPQSSISTHPVIFNTPGVVR